MNAIEITGLRKAYPDFELAGLDLCQRLTERFVFRAERVKLLAQRGELLFDLAVGDGLMHLVMAVHIQRCERDERAARDQTDLFHV